MVTTGTMMTAETMASGTPFIPIMDKINPGTDLKKYLQNFIEMSYAGFYKEEKTSHFFHLLFYHGDSCDRLLFCVEHIR